ncbi:MAG: DUF4180 domain-containing protein [Phenylobacterium sp.]
MTGELRQLAGRPAFVCADDGPLLASERDATDIIGETLGADAGLVVIPVARLGQDFFELRTRLAGEMLQKFVNYRRRVAIVGDISAQVEASEALRDFVRESNRGGSVWFVPDLQELERRLAGA